MSKTGPDRRQSPRADCKIPISISFPDKKTFIKENIINISEGGMFIRLSDPPPVGTTIEFQFNFNKDHESIVGTAMVTWNNTLIKGEKPFDGGPIIPGIGIKFLDLPEKSQTFISQMVLQKLKVLKKAKLLK